MSQLKTILEERKPRIDYSKSPTHCKNGHEYTVENTRIAVDGYRVCKQCGLEASRKFVAKDPEHYRRLTKRYDREAWFNRDNNRAKMQALNKKYRKLSPQKTKARQDLTRAVFEKKIIKPSNCEKCNEPVKKERLHGHHYDYNRSFDVLWLCSPCHQRLHWTKVGELV